MELAELEFKINAVGDFNAVADRLGISAERGRHLVGRLDVQLVGVEAPARSRRPESCRSGCRAGPRGPWRRRDGDNGNRWWRPAAIPVTAAEIAQRVVERTVEAVVLEFEIEAAGKGLARTIAAASRARSMRSAFRARAISPDRHPESTISPSEFSARISLSMRGL